MPTVSVIIPAKDAAEALPRALESIAAQNYPNIIEVIVATSDRESTDAATSHERAIVVDNPSGSTPTALNLAWLASTGDIIARCDAQSVLPPGYISRAVETMRRTGAANVGGRQLPIGETRFQRAIAAAMTSPLGAGDARYRRGGTEGAVETVYSGAKAFFRVVPVCVSIFRREPITAVVLVVETVSRCHRTRVVAGANGIVAIRPAGRLR